MTRPLRYVIDRRVRVLDGGRALLGGDPTRLMRLSDAGARLVSMWMGDGVGFDAQRPASEAQLIERLVDASMLHPAPEVGRADEPHVSALSVVVPVRDRPEALHRCLSALHRSGVTRIIVVDDGSIDVGAHRAVAEEFAAVMVRHDRARGPAAARMAGVAAVRRSDEDPYPLIAFIDSDIEVGEGWLGPLIALFDDQRTVLVAPRVRSVVPSDSRSPSLIEQYEHIRSPLDLGADPAPIRAGTRVSYVPAAALVVRRSAFDEVGGFDASMTVGEDVDLVWRLADAGWRCRYEPAAEVTHHGRTRWAQTLGRRFDYGRSAAPLDVRHPGSVAPVAGSPWSFAAVGAALTGHPCVSAGIGVWSWWSLRSKLGPLTDAGEVAGRLVVSGHLGLVRQLAASVVRPWFPLTAVACVLSRRSRVPLVIAMVASPLENWVRERPDVDPVRWVGAYLADDVAYSLGVWAGCFRARRWGPLMPRWRTPKRDQ